MIQLRAYQEKAQYKICSKCGIEKIINGFYFRKDSKDGKTGICIECLIEKQNIYKKNYPEKKLLSDRKYKLNNKEKINKKNKEYKKANRTKINNQAKKYYENNKETIDKKNIKYYYTNKKKIRQQATNHKKTRLKNDPIFRLKEIISNLFRITLKNQLIKKTKRFFKYTEIHIDEYIKNFKQSNYWDDFYNGDNIHIDHLIPISAYDFNNPNEIKKCWNPRNLRLLPAKENLSKNNIIDLNLIRKYNIIDLLPEGLNLNE